MLSTLLWTVVKWLQSFYRGSNKKLFRIFKVNRIIVVRLLWGRFILCLTQYSVSNSVLYDYLNYFTWKNIWEKIPFMYWFLKYCTDYKNTVFIPTILYSSHVTYWIYPCIASAPYEAYTASLRGRVHCGYKSICSLQRHEKYFLRL